MPDWIVSFPDRLDAFLATEARMPSRAKAQKAIEDGHVRVNDEVMNKAAFRVQEGDKVTLDSPAPDLENAETQITPVDLHLLVLYEDATCWVINKPAGIAVHPGAGMAPGEVTLLSGIAFLYKKQKLSFTTESVLVHRLDKETTGCILVAKNPEAHRFLQEQFETRTIKKTYLALVAGVPTHDEAMVDAPIGRSVQDRTKMSVRASFTSREAQTTYKVLDSGKNAALLECDLHTGRTHQVRVHLSSIGHPVLGDHDYTSSLSERLNQEFEIESLCLHAWKLLFKSFINGQDHAVIAEIPEMFRKVMRKVGVIKPPFL